MYYFVYWSSYHRIEPGPGGLEPPVLPLHHRTVVGRGIEPLGILYHCSSRSKTTWGLTPPLRYYYEKISMQFLPEVTLPALDKALCDRIPTNFNFIMEISRGSRWPPESQPPTYRLYVGYYPFLVIQFQNLRKILGFFTLILPLASRMIFSSPSIFTSL